MITLTSNKTFNPFGKKSKFEEALDRAIQSKVYAFIEIRALAAKVDIGILNSQEASSLKSANQGESPNPRARLIDAVIACQKELETVYSDVPLCQEELITLSKHAEWPRITDFMVRKSEVIQAKKIDDLRWQVRKHSSTAHYYRGFEKRQKGEALYSACGQFAGEYADFRPAKSNDHRCGNCLRIV